jgi:hypothetical protein
VKIAYFTTPPPPRPPPPKAPLFTRDVFSTRSLGPGHLVGAGVLVLGIAGIARLFLGRSRAEIARSRALALPRMAAGPTNDRGQYEKGR